MVATFTEEHKLLLTTLINCPTFYWGKVITVDSNR